MHPLIISIQNNLLFCMQMIPTKKIIFLAFIVIANQTFAIDGFYNAEHVGKIIEKTKFILNRKEYDKAEESLMKAVSHMTQLHSLKLRYLLATLYRERKDYLAEATAYHDILQIVPDDIEAVPGQTFALIRLGAVDLAADYSAEKPAFFNKAELLSFRQLQAGRHIKWGEIDARYGIGLQRFNSADKSILENTLGYRFAYDKRT